MAVCTSLALRDYFTKNSNLSFPEKAGASVAGAAVIGACVSLLALSIISLAGVGGPTAAWGYNVNLGLCVGIGSVEALTIAGLVLRKCGYGTDAREDEDKSREPPPYGGASQQPPPYGDASQQPPPYGGASQQQMS